MSGFTFGAGSRVVFLGDSLTQRTGLLTSEVPAKRYRMAYMGSYVDIFLKRMIVHNPDLQIAAWNRALPPASTGKRRQPV